jgi:enamine deaminase RidA (YjgF/YER057c/UK114 family)
MNGFSILLAAALLPLSAAAVAAAPAQGGVRQNEATVLMPEDPRQRKFQEDWGFAQAITVGDMIYLSGIVVGKRPEDADMTVSYERVYRQIEAILKRAGASWDDVVDISSFHTDPEGQIRSMVAVHKRYVKAPYPAWTAVGSSQILGGGITEIKVVAKRPKANARRK